MRQYPRRTVSAALLLVGWIGARSATAKVAPVPLAKLISGSEYILLAHVEEVQVLNGMRIARAVPDELLKGDKALPFFYFVAEGTWECDTSDAVKGETALLFLTRTGPQVTRKGRKPPVQVKLSPLFQVAAAGRGRMPLRTREGGLYRAGAMTRAPYAAVWSYDVVLPATMAAHNNSQVPWEKLVLLSEMRQAISDTLRRALKQ